MWNRMDSRRLGRTCRQARKATNTGWGIQTAAEIKQAQTNDQEVRGDRCDKQRAQVGVDGKSSDGAGHGQRGLRLGNRMRGCGCDLTRAVGG